MGNVLYLLLMNVIIGKDFHLLVMVATNLNFAHIEKDIMTVLKLMPHQKEIEKNREFLRD